MTRPHILITGSSGTIGTALVEQLLEREFTVTGLDKISNPWSERVNKRTVQTNLSADDAFEKLPDGIDLVVHLAANARVYNLVKDPSKALENINTTFSVLEYARFCDADIVFASSREVYGNKDQIIHAEGDTLVDECESPYTASKLSGEALVKSYGQCYDIEASILRFSNVYGRYDASDRVVPLFIARAANGMDLTVYGEGKVLDFTYLDDCVQGVVRVVKNFHRAKGETFNISSGDGTSLIELAQRIIEKTDGNSDIHIEANRTGEVKRFVADVSKAKKLIHYEPEYGLNDGLERTLDWYQNHESLQDVILHDENDGPR